MKYVMKTVLLLVLMSVLLFFVGCTGGPSLSTDGSSSVLPPSDVSLPVTETPTTETVYVASVFLECSEKNIYIGDCFTIAVTVLPENADNKNYGVTISDPKILSYENGVFTGLKSGNVTVTFLTEDGGKTAECTVKVLQKTTYPTDSRYDAETKLPVYQPVFEEETEYVDFPAKNVKHIFTHDLVAFEDPTEHFYKECVTVKEFKEILRQLYENDFVLIDIDYLYEYSYVDGVLHAKYKNTIKVPAGKKPLVLSVDNVAYPIDAYSAARVSGLQVVNGELKTFVREKNGEISYVEDGDIFPILEKFIKEYPDFSFSGAKCTVCPSGRWGVFGWDTRIGVTDYENNLAEAKKVAEWFAANGYAFACHSYYHEDMCTATVERIEEDFAKWNEEVYPIVGRTHIYIYPLGAFPKQNSAQAKALTASGHAVFCGTSVMSAAWDRNFPDQGNVYAERITLSGRDLYDYAGGSVNKSNTFASYGLFDPKTVYDNDAHSKKIDW